MILNFLSLTFLFNHFLRFLRNLWLVCFIRLRRCQSFFHFWFTLLLFFWLSPNRITFPLILLIFLLISLLLFYLFFLFLKNFFGFFIHNWCLYHNRLFILKCLFFSLILSLFFHFKIFLLIL